VKTVTIRVTKEDIKYGVYADKRACPVAFAVARLLKKPVIVYPWFVFEELDPLVHAYPGVRKLFPTTKKMNKFINAFDSEQKVVPTSFRVRLETV
jgi:hypothetical protein